MLVNKIFEFLTVCDDCFSLNISWWALDGATSRKSITFTSPSGDCTSMKPPLQGKEERKNVMQKQMLHIYQVYNTVLS